MQPVRAFFVRPDVFPTEDSFTTWLMTALKAGGGEYHVLASLPSAAPAPENLGRGFIVLFVYKKRIIGEAVVRRYDKPPVNTPSDEESQAVVTFVNGSIRLFSPPVPADKIQGFPFTHGSPGVDWDIYHKILAHLSESGSFV